jgi:hypothetical protein
MTPWYAKVFFVLLILCLPLLAYMSKQRFKRFGEKPFFIVAITSVLLAFSAPFLASPAELVLTGTAQAKTLSEAVEKAKSAAISAIPSGLKNRAYRIVGGGGLLDSGSSGIQIVRTKDGYRATVTIEVDEYAFDKP